MFERRLCRLLVFGAAGLVTRWEQYDAEREEEALARFDELTSEPSRGGFPPVPARAATRFARRVRPNAATANATRFEAAMLADLARAAERLAGALDARAHQPPSAPIDERVHPPREPLDRPRRGPQR